MLARDDERVPAGGRVDVHERRRCARPRPRSSRAAPRRRSCRTGSRDRVRPWPMSLLGRHAGAPTSPRATTRTAPRARQAVRPPLSPPRTGRPTGDRGHVPKAQAAWTLAGSEVAVDHHAAPSSRPARRGCRTPFRGRLDDRAGARSNSEVFQRVWELYAAGRGTGDPRAPRPRGRVAPRAGRSGGLPRPRRRARVGERRRAAPGRASPSCSTTLREVDGCVVASGRDLGLRPPRRPGRRQRCSPAWRSSATGASCARASFLSDDDALAWVSARPALP